MYVCTYDLHNLKILTLYTFRSGDLTDNPSQFDGIICPRSTAWDGNVYQNCYRKSILTSGPRFALINRLDGRALQVSLKKQNITQPRIFCNRNGGFPLLQMTRIMNIYQFQAKSNGGAEMWTFNINESRQLWVNSGIGKGPSINDVRILEGGRGS